MINDIDKRISRALSSVRQAFRSVLTRVNSAGSVQLVQADALAGEQLQDNELFQHYGYTSNPPPGTMAVVLPMGGRTSHGIIIATEHGNYRLQALKPGEVALYTDEGAKIVLKRGRVIETDCDVFRVNCKQWEVNASASAAFNTPTLTASAELTAQGQINGNGGLAIQGGSGASVTGKLVATEDVVGGGKSLIGHKHPGDSGGVTGNPI
ncbi:phage baseplate assembly protein V [Chromobacterium violaceum]|uniref:phage baseplate assembly protein V n=1 Tax=Chromobacterium violaceum TaxID=536 RepID=UPI001E397E40|nr:phage baseplate assembly protein V [Chromobacterium violaceum]MCD0491415.1 phage baseplate assembly protein V [Chromobacterium violaceum]